MHRHTKFRKAALLQTFLPDLVEAEGEPQRDREDVVNEECGNQVRTEQGQRDSKGLKPMGQKMRGMEPALERSRGGRD